MALIYIVEDDESIREIETIALKNSNYIVSAFENAKEFYMKLDELVPGEFLQSFAEDIIGEDSVDVAVAEVFLDFFQFWSGFYVELQDASGRSGSRTAGEKHCSA